MLNTQPVSDWSARPAPIPLLTALLCLVLTACGGGQDGDSGAAAVEPAASAEGAALPSGVADQIVSRERREAPLSATASGTSTAGGVRPDVVAFIAALPVTEVQRNVIHQAARALQATLNVDLARRAELQSTVNELAQARACLRTHVADGDAVWDTLQARTYDTLLRRLRRALFLFASRLLTQWPEDVSCTRVPPPGSGDGGTGGQQPPPVPPPPSAGMQLREEIVRLEQQGVLPTLDRGTDLRGPDVNDNGIRDDIDAYIAALPITDEQKKAAMQTARVQQRSLLMDLSDKAAVKALGDASMAATACIGDRFEPEPGRSYEISLKIEAITANTPERARRYMQYMAALSGTSTAYPEGNTCEE